MVPGRNRGDLRNSLGGWHHVHQGRRHGHASGRPQATIWEMRYLIGATAVCAWMGLFAIYSMAYHTYNSATFIACGVCFGTLVSAVGRNYGSPLIIRSVVMISALPLLLGFVVAGWKDNDIWLATTGIALLPFTAVAIRVSDDVRDIVKENMLSSMRANDIGILLNLALNNQPAGMMMLDHNGKVVVFNTTARNVLDLHEDYPNSSIIGAYFERFIEMLRHHFDMNAREFAETKRQLKALANGETTKSLIKIAGNRHLEFSANHFFNDEEGGSLKGSVIVFSDVSHRHHAEEKMAFLANIDELTNLPNRRHWNELVEAKIASMPTSQRVAIGLLDIDQFRLINETMGQASGDAVIMEISRKLASFRSDRVIVGRYGADEFVVAVCGLKPSEDVEYIFDNLFNSLNQDYVIKGQNLIIHLHGGIFSHTVANLSLSDAISRADYALQKVKGSSSRTWAEFTRTMNGEFDRIVRIKAALRDDFNPEALIIAYQPMFQTDGSSFDCCEALVRWNHPELGLLNPSDFIDIAEDIGSIHIVTRAILAKACRDCVSWAGGMVGVSVNISPINLAHPDIIQTIKDCLQESGLSPDRLTIEVTETVLVNDFIDVSRTLINLQSLGIKIALDDFGTGYSSLSYLTKLSFDKVKVDRSFVTNLSTGDKAGVLLKGIIDLAKTLDFEVVVEGVETNAQLQLILKAGDVDRIQGYLFSKPVSANEINAASRETWLIMELQVVIF